MCIPIPLLSLGLTAATAAVGVKQANDARRAREQAAAAQRQQALDTKSKSDQKLRRERLSGYRTGARSEASGYAAQPDILFSQRSFFATG